MPAAKPTTTADKPARPARRRTSTASAVKPRTRRRKPSHDQIAARAYFIALDGGGDEISNWLQAERELTAA